MNVYLNRIDGIDDAIISMFLSKRHLTRDKELSIRNMVYQCSQHEVTGEKPIGALVSLTEELEEHLRTLFRWGVHHYTMLRFIDLSFTVYGMHRGGQDDLDAHAMRMNNRIIRESTRVATFLTGEMSDYYQGKILPTDAALAVLGIETPEELLYDGKLYVKTTNGYILQGMENSKDVQRGLYLLSIPSSFIFKIQLTEFAHVYKERKMDGSAHPEVKIAVENMTDQLADATMGYVSRSMLTEIRN